MYFKKLENTELKDVYTSKLYYLRIEIYINEKRLGEANHGVLSVQFCTITRIRLLVFCSQPFFGIVAQKQQPKTTKKSVHSSCFHFGVQYVCVLYMCVCACQNQKSTK